MTCSRSVVPPFISRFFALLRMTGTVTIDGAAGEVKDLEYLIGSPRWQPLVILREICSPMMPPGAHITDRSRISPVLPSASASAREDAFFSGIGKWRRSRSRFLRGELPSYAQRRQSDNASAHKLLAKGCSFERPSEQIYLGKRLPARASYNSCVSIDCFSCKIMPFFNFSHRLLQVIRNTCQKQNTNRKQLLNKVWHNSQNPIDYKDITDKKPYIATTNSISGL